MEGQHRRRTIVGSILNWYYGPLRLIKERRQRKVATGDERGGSPYKQRVCPDAWNPTERCDYYIRTVRGDNKDPLTQFLMKQGVPAEPDVMKPNSVTVFSFAMKSPRGAVTRTQLTAIEQLELWKTYALHWCEHKPSVTITVKEHEWMEVGAWVYENFDVASGVSFLPHSDHTYQQAPYQDINSEDYEKWQVAHKDIKIDWEKLTDFEKEDNTSGSRELACTAGVCEVVDLNAG